MLSRFFLDYVSALLSVYLQEEQLGNNQRAKVVVNGSH